MNLYFIAIVLPEKLNQEIIDFKNEMLEHYGCRNALKSPAHITLIPPFSMDDHYENKLTEELKLFSKNIQPFTMQASQFAFFGDRTLYIEVLPQPSLSVLKKELDNFYSGKTVYGIKKETRPFHPHITIANRDIPRERVAEIKKAFFPRIIHLNWEAASISVLKHLQKKWDVVHTSHFANILNA